MGGNPDVSGLGASGAAVLDERGRTRVSNTVSAGRFFNGASALGDLDGDGEVEVVTLANRRRPEESALYAFDSECFDAPFGDCAEGERGVRWSVSIDGVIGGINWGPPLLFDFEGDGAPEVVFQDTCHVQAFAGADGRRLWSLGGLRNVTSPLPSVAVADVDADGRAELVAGFSNPGVGRPEPDVACPPSEALATGFACDAATPCPSAAWSCRRGQCVSPVQQNQGIAVYRDRFDRWAPTDRAWTHVNYRPGAFAPDGDPLPRDEWTPAWRNPDDPGFRIARPLGPLDADDPAPDLTSRALAGWACEGAEQSFRAEVCNRGARLAPRQLRLRAEFTTPSGRPLCSVPVDADLAPGGCTEVACAFRTTQSGFVDVNVVVVVPPEAAGIECHAGNNGDVFPVDDCLVD